MVVTSIGQKGQHCRPLSLPQTGNNVWAFVPTPCLSFSACEGKGLQDPVGPIPDNPWGPKTTQSGKVSGEEAAKRRGGKGASLLGKVQVRASEALITLVPLAGGASASLT
jgi:hypothetical protein